MAVLFDATKQNIAKHLKAIFAEGELSSNSVVNHWLTTAGDGKKYRVAHYNLDAVLAVGYHVRSPRGTQFRQWATTHLREYQVKGFVMAQRFFQRVQNKMLWAVTGCTAPSRAHHTRLGRKTRRIFDVQRA